MNRYYVICDGDAVFFSSRKAADDFQEEEYYRCTGDVRRVPDESTHYSVKDEKGNVFCVFSTNESAEFFGCDKKIEVRA